MTEEQRDELANVRKLLVKGSTSSANLDHASEAEKISHIPMELLKEQKQSRKGSITSVSSADPGASNYILQEFAGVRKQTILSNLNEETSEDSCSTSVSKEEEEPVDEKEDAHETNLDETTEQVSSKPVEAAALSMKPRCIHTLSEEEAAFVPPQFTGLSQEAQVEVFEMLSWEAMTTWGYDIFKLDTLTNGNALLFLSWATVAHPQAQNAMAKACGTNHVAANNQDGYSFVEIFGIVPSILCNYATAVQEQYHAENPYHNAIHAADVLQTLHTLIQMKGVKHFDRLDVFAILLSAIVHDVNHSGTTNAFHTNLRTELAVMYNDASVLENWHVACAFACMLGLNLEDASQQHYEALTDANRPTDRNILTNMDTEDFSNVRNRMIEAVLHTDMTKHFAMVNACKALLLVEEDDEEAACSSWKLLMFMLHMADISAQAKPDPLFRHWTVRCMDEFFDQGDLEAKYNLPVSPNCCRETTNIAQSQLGFVKFVVGPAFDVLGGFIPAVEREVLPIIEENLNAWMAEV